jgi:hypothetical protein
MNIVHRHYTRTVIALCAISICQSASAGLFAGEDLMDLIRRQRRAEDQLRGHAAPAAAQPQMAAAAPKAPVRLWAPVLQHWQEHKPEIVIGVAAVAGSSLARRQHGMRNLWRYYRTYVRRRP